MAGFALMSKEVYIKWSSDLIIYNWGSEITGVERLNFPAISIIGKYRIDTKFYEIFTERIFGWNTKYENMTSVEFFNKFITLE